MKHLSFLILFVFNPRYDYDTARVAAQIVSGVGFIGGGVIWKTKDSVGGVTTAASIWYVASIGMTCATGHYATAILATCIILTVLRFGHRDVAVPSNEHWGHLKKEDREVLRQADEEGRPSTEEARRDSSYAGPPPGAFKRTDGEGYFSF